MIPIEYITDDDYRVAGLPPVIEPTGLDRARAKMADAGISAIPDGWELLPEPESSKIKTGDIVKDGDYTLVAISDHICAYDPESPLQCFVCGKYAEQGRQ